MSKAVFSIFKDEAPYLKEWVAFHKIQGFEKFYLYNNESSDNWEQEIKTFIQDGTVQITDWPGNAQQLPAYRDYIDQMKTSPDKPRWTAFIDIDEFIYSPTGEQVGTILDNNTHYDCLTATWLMFGFNNHKNKPEGLVIENYTSRASHLFKSDHFKSIIDVAKIIDFPDPHRFNIIGETINLEELKINHYWTKSEKEWQEKWQRGRSDTGGKHDLKKSLEDIENFSEFEDFTIKNLWSEKVKNFIKELNE